MDPNITVLLILLSVASAVGVLAIIFRSSTIRKHGLLGALRRRFSGGSAHSRYDS